MMTNFPAILSRLTGMPPEGRVGYIDSIGRYDLLILDDLGVERNTSYAMEQMKNPPDLEHSRIYSRILEHCAPILFSGKDMRKDTAATTKTTARAILSSKAVL